MRKQLLALCLALTCCANGWADDSQTTVINGVTTSKTVKQITFQGDDIILHYADGTQEAATDMELVTITFSNATGITKPNRALDTNAVWYDLSGRRLPGIPTQSGTYIKRTASKTIKVQK